MSRQYLNAAQIVQAVQQEGQSLKRYCHNKDSKIGKTEYLLACETLKYSELIEKLFEMSEVDVDALGVSNSVIKVMTYEILFGKGKIQGGGVVKRKLLDHVNILQSSLREEMERQGASSADKLLSCSIQLASSLPKYVRINEIAAPIAPSFEVVQESYPAARIDQHIPSLVCLPPDASGVTDFVKKHTASDCAGGRHNISKFIIQDKASCMPSQVLFEEYLNYTSTNPEALRKSDFLDACAAPGNKTSHLASLLFASGQRNNTNNRIFAFDKSVNRSQLLRQRMSAAGATNVTVENMNFLEVDTKLCDYSNVRYFLVDPSCSGSGVVRALERVLENSSKVSLNCNRHQHVQDDRLLRLQEFQIQAISKAMSFPAAEFVVYSTCSVHKEENEDVVQRILQDFTDWDVQSPLCLESWHRRGQHTEGLTEIQQHALIRCLPEDGMNGFFIALFRKRNNLGISSRSSLELGHSCMQRSDETSSSTNCKSNKRKRDTERQRHQISTKKTNVRSDVVTSGKKARKIGVLRVWKPKKRR